MELPDSFSQSSFSQLGDIIQHCPAVSHPDPISVSVRTDSRYFSWRKFHTRNWCQQCWKVWWSRRWTKKGSVMTASHSQPWLGDPREQAVLPDVGGCSQQSLLQAGSDSTAKPLVCCCNPGRVCKAHLAGCGRFVLLGLRTTWEQQPPAGVCKAREA